MIDSKRENLIMSQQREQQENQMNYASRELLYRL
jgi:hypothetical protein